MKTDLLKNKRILVVDDEPDVLEIMEELIPMSEIMTATNFDEAKEILEKQSIDLAILDIMGVDGYKLLEIANKKEVIAVMLTAHALNPGNVKKSIQKGAAYYVPKEKMSEIVTYLNDVLEAKEAGTITWATWMNRFFQYFNEKFGSDWQDEDEEFWKKKTYV
jgi:DNA-binding NtrC family response regulator